MAQRGGVSRQERWTGAHRTPRGKWAQDRDLGGKSREFDASEVIREGGSE